MELLLLSRSANRAVEEGRGWEAWKVRQGGGWKKTEPSGGEWSRGGERESEITGEGGQSRRETGMGDVTGGDGGYFRNVIEREREGRCALLWPDVTHEINSRHNLPAPSGDLE